MFVAGGLSGPLGIGSGAIKALGARELVSAKARALQRNVLSEQLVQEIVGDPPRAGVISDLRHHHADRPRRAQLQAVGRSPVTKASYEYLFAL